MGCARSWALTGAVVVGWGLLAGCGGDDDSDAGSAGAALGGQEQATQTADAAGSACRVDTTPVDTDEPEEPAPPPGQADTTGPMPELPPPTRPDEASPPTTRGETTLTDLGEDPYGPLTVVGGLGVDPPELGCVDVAVSLRRGQRIQVLSLNDDGIYTHVQVYAPSGNVVGEWDTGEPGTQEGYHWRDTGMPEEGVYVFRAVHRRGSHNAFTLAFYGEA